MHHSDQAALCLIQKTRLLLLAIYLAHFRSRDTNYCKLEMIEIGLSWQIQR